MLWTLALDEHLGGIAATTDISLVSGEPVLRTELLAEGLGYGAARAASTLEGGRAMDLADPRGELALGVAPHAVLSRVLVLSMHSTDPEAHGGLGGAA